MPSKNKSWIQTMFGRRPAAEKRAPRQYKPKEPERQQKDLVLEGGFEILSRLIGGGLSKTQLLNKYAKSLYVFACISKIAEKTASLEFRLSRVVNSKGEVQEVTLHPAIDLIYKPNPFQTKREYFELTIINLKCTGEAFWYKVRNTKGAVVEMWNLRPDYMEVVADPSKFIKEYRLTKTDGTVATFVPEDIVHLKYNDPTNPYGGVGPLHAASRRVETEDYATAWQRDFFLNSARPDGLIKNPKSYLDKEQKDEIRQSWEKRHRGPGNSAKIAILDGGLEYQLISLSQKEMDYIESLKFTRDDILVAFHVPKPVVSITDDVNLANAETGMAIFLGETIKPEADRLIEKLNEELIAPDFGAEFFLDFPDPTPQNRDMMLKEHTQLVGAGILLINEARAIRGLPPVRGGWSFYMPLTSQPMGGLDQQKALIGGDTAESAYEGGRPQEKARVFDFRGKALLKAKLEFKERLVDAVMKDVNERRKKTKAVKSAKRSLIPKPEIQVAYAGMVNKKIDVKSESLEKAVNAFADAQKTRVVAALMRLKERGKKSDKKITVSVSKIFDEKKEGRMAIEFISPYITQYLYDSAKDALDMIAPQEDFKTTAKVEDFIKTRATDFAESVNSTTLQGLESTLAEGIAADEGIDQLAARAAAEFEGYPSYRSKLIARTEATAANNQGLLEGFRQSGVANGKEWINAGDASVREAHQNGSGVGGEIVPLDDSFSNGLDAPCEPNCRCVLGPAIIE